MSWIFICYYKSTATILPNKIKLKNGAEFGVSRIYGMYSIAIWCWKNSKKTYFSTFRIKLLVILPNILAFGFFFQKLVYLVFVAFLFVEIHPIVNSPISPLIIYLIVIKNFIWNIKNIYLQILSFFTNYKKMWCSLYIRNVMFDKLLGIWKK